MSKRLYYFVGFLVCLVLTEHGYAQRYVSGQRHVFLPEHSQALALVEYSQGADRTTGHDTEVFANLGMFVHRLGLSTPDPNTTVSFHVGYGSQGYGTPSREKLRQGFSEVFLSQASETPPGGRMIVVLGGSGRSEGMGYGVLAELRKTRSDVFNTLEVVVAGMASDKVVEEHLKAIREGRLSNLDSSVQFLLVQPSTIYNDWTPRTANGLSNVVNAWASCGSFISSTLHFWGGHESDMFQSVVMKPEAEGARVVFWTGLLAGLKETPQSVGRAMVTFSELGFSGASGSTLDVRIHQAGQWIAIDEIRYASSKSGNEISRDLRNQTGVTEYELKTGRTPHPLLLFSQRLEQVRSHEVSTASLSTERIYPLPFERISNLLETQIRVVRETRPNAWPPPVRARR